MYSYTGLVGSLIQTLDEPTNEYREGPLLFKEWEIDIGIKNIKFSFVQKSIISHKDRVLDWIDRFDFLPEYIILDAKRLCDETNNSIHPARYAIAAIYESCLINKYNLDRDKLFNILKSKNKEIKNKAMFISIIKNSNLISSDRIKLVKTLGVLNG